MRNSSAGARRRNVSQSLLCGALCVLSGGIGAHKFYLGQAGLGILYLLFCWTFIPAFVGVIEGFLYLSMSDDSFNARYNAI